MDEAAKHAGGRPTDYSPEIAEEICERIATTPRGLDLICDGDEALPCARTVHRWLNTHDEFCQSYKRARDRQADLLFDQCLPIADDSAGDVVIETREDGSSFERFDAERVARAKLRVDTRMRMAGKLAPKKYGERTVIAGDEDAPLQASVKVEFVKARGE